MMAFRHPATLVAGLFLASTCVLAHHGGSLYDTSATVTLRGAVTQFRFVFPHVLVYFAVEGENGETVEWSGEMTTPNRLSRGVGGGGATNNIRWTTGTLTPGDVIEVTGNAARNGAPAMRVLGIVDANGVALLGGEEGESGPVAGRPASRGGAGVGAGADLSGVWMRRYDAPYQNYAFTAEPPAMTAWGQERYEATRPTFGPRGVAVAETNDPVYRCLPPGLPRIYAHPAPFEIVHTPDRVMIVYEYQHHVRNIYTDGRGHREGRPPSWMGESAGRWEGETLVVETVNFNDRTWLDRRGLPHSEELRLTERIYRSGDNELTIDLTVEDPVAYTQPWTATRVFDAVDWQLEESVCIDDEAFGDFERALLDYGNGAGEN